MIFKRFATLLALKISPFHIKGNMCVMQRRYVENVQNHNRRYLRLTSVVLLAICL